MSLSKLYLKKKKQTAATKCCMLNCCVNWKWNEIDIVIADVRGGWNTVCNEGAGY